MKMCLKNVRLDFDTHSHTILTFDVSQIVVSQQQRETFVTFTDDP